MTEDKLEVLANEGFIVTSLRFATACGHSERLRLDLVLNDFVASAMASSKILILSDGTPWRPLITVNDMARAIGWAAQRPLEKGGAHLIVNTGSDEWNYRIIDLGKIIKNCLPNIELEVANSAPSDDRSYRVDFTLFKGLAQGYLPVSKVEDVVIELWEGLQALNFSDPDFRNSTLCRLVKIQELTKHGYVDNHLRWSVL